jgi:hypothetical protein
MKRGSGNGTTYLPENKATSIILGKKITELFPKRNIDPTSVRMCINSCMLKDSCDKGRTKHMKATYNPVVP